MPARKPSWPARRPAPRLSTTVVSHTRCSVSLADIKA